MPNLPASICGFFSGCWSLFWGWLGGLIMGVSKKKKISRSWYLCTHCLVVWKTKTHKPRSKTLKTPNHENEDPTHKNIRVCKTAMIDHNHSSYTSQVCLRPRVSVQISLYREVTPPPPPPQQHTQLSLA